jgi:hypothetical protein
MQLDGALTDVQPTFSETNFASSATTAQTMVRAMLVLSLS